MCVDAVFNIMCIQYNSNAAISWLISGQPGVNYKRTLESENIEKLIKIQLKI